MEVSPDPHGQDLDFQETASDASSCESISGSGEDNEVIILLFFSVRTIVVAKV